MSLCVDRNEQVKVELCYVEYFDNAYVENVYFGFFFIFILF